MDRILWVLTAALWVCGAAEGNDFSVISGEAHGRLTRKGSPYLVRGKVVVPYGRRLEVEPGVVLKFQAVQPRSTGPGIGDVGRLVVEGSIRAVGTPEAPIVFTSSQDQTVAPGGAQAKTVLPWGWVEVLGMPKQYVTNYHAQHDPSWMTEEEHEALHAGTAHGGGHGHEAAEAPAQDTTSVFAHCIVKYAGYHWSFNLYATVTLQACEFTENLSAPIGIFGGRPTVRDCRIFKNHSHGIQVHLGGSAVIEGNRILDNAGAGVYARYAPRMVIRWNVIRGHSVGIQDPSGSAVIEENAIAGNRYGVKNPQAFFAVQAARNYWGDASGPKDTVDDRDREGDYNPEGRGDEVEGRVVYRPFLTEPPAGLAVEDQN